MKYTKKNIPVPPDFELLLQGLNITFCPDSYSVLCHNSLIQLGPREYILLRHLVKNQGRIVPTQVLEEIIFEKNWDKIQSNALAVHIHHLRRKLPYKIKTIRNKGYMLMDEE